jgi:hypothetical protein
VAAYDRGHMGGILAVFSRRASLFFFEKKNQKTFA